MLKLFKKNKGENEIACKTPMNLDTKYWFQSLFAFQNDDEQFGQEYAQISDDG